jgi:hypothetical protein
MPMTWSTSSFPDGSLPNPFNLPREVQYVCTAHINIFPGSHTPMLNLETYAACQDHHELWHAM